MENNYTIIIKFCSSGPRLFTCICACSCVLIHLKHMSLLKYNHLVWTVIIYFLTVNLYKIVMDTLTIYNY